MKSRLTLLALVATLVALLLPGLAWAPTFLGGPSVRVSPNTQVTFEWQTDVAWVGEVDITDNPNDLYDQQLVKIISATGAATLQEALAAIGLAPLTNDTTLYFRVVATDPNDSTSHLYFPALGEPPLPFFTGAQALSNLQVTPGVTSAQISWQANVIGDGQVQYGQTIPYTKTQTDAMNVTDHSFTLTGLQPATNYVFRVCNLHAIDGDCLASSTGSFTTLSTFTDQYLSPLVQSTDPTNAQINTGKNGKVVPVKVQISQGGTAITNLNAPGPVTIAVSKFACGSSAGTDPVTTYADAGQSSAGTNQFTYDATIPGWIYNLDTKALDLVTGNCYRIDVSVNGSQIMNASTVFQPTK